MLSHDDIIQRALESAGHRKRQVNIYVQDRRIFSASHNLRISACLFHIKYNVEPDKSIQNHVPNHVLKCH